LAHKAIGTFERATVRLGFSFFNTEDEVEIIIIGTVNTNTVPIYTFIKACAINKS